MALVLSAHRNRLHRRRGGGGAMEMTYLSRIPDELPAGQVLAHNHVRPARRLGVRGFRAWLQPPDDRLAGCDCDWAGRKHYRVTREQEADDQNEDPNVA